jgi:methyl-accepting chemotaxis protein
MKSIKTQMITVLIVFTIVICSILGVVSYIIFRGAVIDQVNENLLKMAEEAALLVSSRIEVQLTYLETLSENNVVTDVIVDGMSSATSVTMEDKLPYLKKEAERMGFDAIGISDLHGLADRSDGTTEIIGSYDFFAKAAKGNSNVSDVIISKSTKKASIFFAAPAFREGKLVNVVYGVRNAMELSRMIEDISYGTSGYAFIINKDGTLMAHPDFKQVSDMTNYIEIAKEDAGLEELGGILENRITQEEAGVDRYVLDGLEKISDKLDKNTRGSFQQARMHACNLVVQTKILVCNLRSNNLALWNLHKNLTSVQLMVPFPKDQFCHLWA